MSGWRCSQTLLATDLTVCGWLTCWWMNCVMLLAGLSTGVCSTVSALLATNLRTL